MSKTITIKGLHKTVTVRADRIDGVTIAGNTIQLTMTTGQVDVKMYEIQGEYCRGNGICAGSWEAVKEIEAEGEMALKKAANTIKRAMTGSG